MKFFRLLIILLALSIFLPQTVWAKPPVPLTVKAEDTGEGGKVKVTWQRPTFGLVLDYNVYRSTKDNALGTKVGRDISGELYADSGLKDKVIYYYRVRSVDQDGVESDSSSFVSATPTDTIAPGAPASPRARTDAKGGKVTISWSAPAGERVVGYQIFRSSLPDLVGNKIATVTRRSYTEVSLPAGVVFYYSIKAVDKAGNLSAASAQVPATVVNENDTPLLVSDFQAKATGRSGEIRISWRNPTLSNFSHNRLYRSLGAQDRGGLIINNLRGSSYTDRNLINGQQYYYTLQSVSKGGVEYENLQRQISASPAARGATVPPPTEKLRAFDKGDGQSVELRWTNPASHAFSRIRIYRSSDPDSLGQLLSSGLRVNTFIDQDGLESDARYYYTVKTVTSGGAESDDNIAVGGIPTVALAGEGEGGDADGDGLPDDWERANGYHPRRQDDPGQDDDLDGLGLLEEYTYQSNPWNPDSDGDGYDDGTEVANGFNPQGSGRIGQIQNNASGPAVAFAYGQTRLPSLRQEEQMAKKLRSELEQVLRGAEIDKARRYWFLLVNSYVYGGYTAEEIASTIKTGPGKVHPAIPAASWRQGSEYKRSK